MREIITQIGTPPPVHPTGGGVLCSWGHPALKTIFYGFAAGRLRVRYSSSFSFILSGISRFTGAVHGVGHAAGKGGDEVDVLHHLAVPASGPWWS